MVHKVKIIETDYNEQYHIIFWKLLFIDPNDSLYNQEKVVAYRANDLAASVLNKPNFKITPELARFFNKEILNKEKNIVVETEIKKLPENLSSLSEKEYSEISSVLENYPYEELYNIFN